MLFYQIATPEGPRLVRTQGEAKQRDPGFKPFEFPTDKDGQMAVLNDLLAGVVATSVEPEQEPVEIVPVAGDGPVSLIGLKLTEIDRILLRTGIEDVILSTLTSDELDRLEPVIAERRADLAKVAA